MNCLQHCASLVCYWIEIELLTAVCFFGLIVFRELIEYRSVLFVVIWFESELLKLTDINVLMEINVGIGECT